MKYIKILILSLVVAFYSCTTASKNTSEAGHDESEHQEEEQTITELTADQMKAVGIELGPIEQRDISNKDRVNGMLKVPNSDKAVVTAMFGGIINTVNIHEGDYVRKGQVIATISNPEYIDVQEQYLVVKNQIAYAEQEVARQQELFDNGAGAKKNLQSASTELKDLRTKRASLTKRLQMMGLNVGMISDSNIKNGLAITAPISGTVSTLFAKVGSYIDVSSSVAEIIDNSAIHLDLYIFEKDISGIRLGQSVEFSLTNLPNKLYKAKVSSIGSSFEDDSKTIVIHCSIEGSKAGLIDGMSAVGTINLSSTLSLVVPTTAIVDVEGKSYIFIQTDKEIEDHDHDHEKEKDQAHEEQATKELNGNLRFEKIEVAKGASDQGYTAIVPVIDLPKDVIIVVKGAFFVNAKMSNTGEHEH